jgi:hypothetical protein
MPDCIPHKWWLRPSRARLLVLASLASGALVAGCGSSSSTTTAAQVAAPSTAAASATTGTSTASSHSTATTGDASGPLGFAECMRANGVPNFPDPNPGHGSLFNLGSVDASSPAFDTAESKCQHFMGPGPLAPGNESPGEKAKTLVKLRKIAVCMRAHGVSQFPDPTATAPASPPSGVSVLTNFDGVFLAFPSSINLQAPAYRQALTACGAPPLGLPH